MSRKRSQKKHPDSESEEETKRIKVIPLKNVSLNLCSASSMPFVRLDQNSQIASFFASPIPFYFGRALDGNFSLSQAL
jgi:hypothetical protein